MKDRNTQRAVRNILHNELGVTNENVEKIITDFVNKKSKKIFDDYLQSSTFQYKVKEQIKKDISKLVGDEVRYHLRNFSLKVNVDFNKKEDENI